VSRLHESACPCLTAAASGGFSARPHIEVDLEQVVLVKGGNWFTATVVPSAMLPYPPRFYLNPPPVRVGMRCLSATLASTTDTSPDRLSEKTSEVGTIWPDSSLCSQSYGVRLQSNSSESIVRSSSRSTSVEAWLAIAYWSSSQRTSARRASWLRAISPSSVASPSAVKYKADPPGSSSTSSSLSPILQESWTPPPDTGAT